MKAFDRSKAQAIVKRHMIDDARSILLKTKEDKKSQLEADNRRRKMLKQSFHFIPKRILVSWIH